MERVNGSRQEWARESLTTRPVFTVFFFFHFHLVGRSPVVGRGTLVEVGRDM